MFKYLCGTKMINWIFTITNTFIFIQLYRHHYQCHHNYHQNDIINNDDDDDDYHPNYMSS